MPRNDDDAPEELDDELDVELEETFPASDPPSIVQPHDLEKDPDAQR